MKTEASRQALWALMEDFPRVARCLPGVEDVRPSGDGTYGGTMRIRLGPIGLTLLGTVELERNEEEGRWRMQAQARDRRVGGGVQATIEVTLTETPTGSAGLDITADVKFMGRLGEMGQPIIKRKADSMIQGFARNLVQAAAGEN